MFLIGTGLETTVQEACEDGDIRLTGGSDPLEGRVEVCFNSAWGTVCDHSFSSSDASVVCTQLGYRFNGTELLPISEFAQGSGPIFFDELACSGEEESVQDCGGSAPGLHTCTHSQDAAIRCIGECYSCINQNIHMRTPVLNTITCLVQPILGNDNGSIYFTLTDYDECAIDNGGCDQICINTIVGQKCECNEGYSLDIDGSSCIANAQCIDGVCQCLDGFVNKNSSGSVSGSMVNCVGE